MRYKVVGPPGTGKTRRLLNEVQKYVDKGIPSKSYRLLCIYS
jgi:Ni2+-binding GTPase involved in maturation of urease and hydrogenase